MEATQFWHGRSRLVIGGFSKITRHALGTFPSLNSSPHDGGKDRQGILDECLYWNIML